MKNFKMELLRNINICIYCFLKFLFLDYNNILELEAS